MLGMRRGLPSSFMRVHAAVRAGSARRRRRCAGPSGRAPARASARGAGELRQQRSDVFAAVQQHAPRRAGWPAIAASALRQRPGVAARGRCPAGPAPTAARARAPAPRRRGVQLAVRQRQVQAAGAVAEGVAVELALRGVQRARGRRVRSATRCGCGARSGRRWCRSSGRARARTRSRSGRRAIVPSSFITSQITAAGVRPAMRGQVAAGFGVAGAHQHAAVLRLQREDVAGLHQVGRPGVACHRGLHGARAVGGRDAGGHARRRPRSTR